MTAWMLLVWIGGSVLFTALLEWAYQSWCRRNGIEPSDIFG